MRNCTPSWVSSVVLPTPTFNLKVVLIQLNSQTTSWETVHPPELVLSYFQHQHLIWKYSFNTVKQSNNIMRNCTPSWASFVVLPTPTFNLKVVLIQSNSQTISWETVHPPELVLLYFLHQHLIWKYSFNTVKQSNNIVRNCTPFWVSFVVLPTPTFNLKVVLIQSNSQTISWETVHPPELVLLYFLHQHLIWK